MSGRICAPLRLPVPGHAAAPFQIDEQIIHLQTVHLGQEQVLQPGDGPLRGERLGGQVTLQVVAAEDVFDFVHDPRAGLTLFFPQGGQPPILLIHLVGDVHLPQATDGLTRQEAISIDPQEFAQRRGVTAVSLAFLPLFRLDQNHLVTAVVMQQADQPIVEAADFQHGDERFSFL